MDKEDIKETEGNGDELLPDPPVKEEYEIDENIWKDNEVVTQPTDTTPADGEKIIIDAKLVNSEEKPVSDNTLFGDTEEGKLPDLQAKFVKVEDGVTKVIDMKEMMNHISQSSTMDRDTAVSIEELFKGFFDNYNIPEMYSSVPCKTGRDRALAFMKRKIAKEEAEVIDTSNAYITLASDNMTILAEKINNEVIPDIISLIRDVQMANNKVMKGIFDTRDSLTMLDEENNEVDVSFLDVEKPRQYHLNYTNDHVEPLNEALNAFNNYMKSKELTHFLFKTLEQEPTPYQEPAHLSLDETLDGLYLNYMTYISDIDLYKIMAYVFSDSFVKSVDSLKYIYTVAATTYKKLSDETEPFKVDNESLDFDRLNQFIVLNSELIRKTNAKVNYANKIIADLPQFLSILENLLLHLKYIFK